MDSNHHEVVNGLFQRRFKQLEHDTDNILGVLKTFLNVCRTEGQTIALTRKDAEVLVSYITNVRVNHALDRRERDELLETWSALTMTMDAVRPGWNTCHPEVPQSPLQNFVRELNCMAIDAAPRAQKVTLTETVEGVSMTVRKMALHDQLASVLNGVSRENESNTPDFILAQFLMRALESFERATQEREAWYGVNLSPGGPIKIAEEPGHG